MKHKHFNRLLSMLLVVATLVGILAVPASAASLEDSGTVTIQQPGQQAGEMLVFHGFSFRSGQRKSRPLKVCLSLRYFTLYCRGQAALSEKPSVPALGRCGPAPFQ